MHARFPARLTSLWRGGKDLLAHELDPSFIFFFGPIRFAGKKEAERIFSPTLTPLPLSFFLSFFLSLSWLRKSVPRPYFSRSLSVKSIIQSTISLKTKKRRAQPWRRRRLPAKAIIGPRPRRRWNVCLTFIKTAGRGKKRLGTNYCKSFKNGNGSFWLLLSRPSTDSFPSKLAFLSSYGRPCSRNKYRFFYCQCIVEKTCWSMAVSMMAVAFNLLREAAPARTRR